jgi:acetyltransferase
MTNDLKALLAPKAIAVVGASEGPRHGGEVIRSLRDSGFSGKVFPVNPRYETVYGHRCFPSLDKIENPVDCVVIAVARNQVPNLFEQAAILGAKGVVIISGGFRETGPEGARMEAQILEIARRYHVRFLGPNTIGHINVHDKVGCYAASLPVGLKPGPVAVAVQSGTVCGAVGGAGRGLNFSYLISTGNETDVTAADLIDYFVDDQASKVIVVFTESIREPDRFIRAASRAYAAGKPIVMLKAGQSEAGQRMSASHTGALADNPRVFAAMARRYRVVIVRTLNEMLATAELFAGLLEHMPTGGGFALMTHSGGEAAVLLDICAVSGFDLPKLNSKTRERLKGVLPDYAHVDNPLDMTGVGAVNGDVFRGCLEALVDDPGIGLVGVMQDVRAGHWVLHQAARITSEVAAKSSTSVMFFSNTTRHFDSDLDTTLQKGRVPFLYGTQEAVCAAQAVLDFARIGPTPVLPSPAKPRPGALAALKRAHDEVGAKRLLELYGISVVRERSCGDKREAIEAADEIGYPVAAKLLSPGIGHKTEVGGVRLGVEGPDALQKACEDIFLAARAHNPTAQLNGILIQEMVTSSVAEIILGIKRDPHFGLVLLCGLGGIYAEVFSDVAIRLAPVDELEARSMIEELTCYPLLTGTRNRPKGDIKALAKAIKQLSDLAMEVGPHLESLDINPIMLLEANQGVRVVDALIVTSD